MTDQNLRYINGYELFGYRGTKDYTTPHENKLDKNIKGIELEVDNIDCYWDNDDDLWVINDDNVTYAFDKLIDRGILLTRDTTDMANNKLNGAISYDSSVNCEINLQADIERNTLRKIREINRYLNKDILNNSKGTSCHIHNNMQYVINNGGNLHEVQKASEFLLPILFKISGRDDYNYMWCRSMFGHNYDVDMIDLASRVDHSSEDRHSHRVLCNGEHRDTAELRIFSNNNNFNDNTIKMYIEFTDLIIDMACYMKGKRYVNEYDTLINIVDSFCNQNHRRRKFLNKFHLNEILLRKQDIEYKRLTDRWNNVYSDLEFYERYLLSNNVPILEQAQEMIRIIRRFENNHNIRFDVPLYTGQVDFDGVRTALNEQYTIEYENL